MAETSSQPIRATSHKATDEDSPLLTLIGQSGYELTVGYQPNNLTDNIRHKPVCLTLNKFT